MQSIRHATIRTRRPIALRRSFPDGTNPCRRLVVGPDARWRRRWSIGFVAANPRGSSRGDRTGGGGAPTRPGTGASGRDRPDRGDAPAKASRSRPRRERGQTSIARRPGRAASISRRHVRRAHVTYLLRYVPTRRPTLVELECRAPRARSRVEFAVPGAIVWHASWWLYTRTLAAPRQSVTGGRSGSTSARFLGPNITGHYRDYPVTWTSGRGTWPVSPRSAPVA